MIGYGIDARRQRFPGRDALRLHAACRGGETYRWDAAAKAGIKDYNLLDLSI